MMHVPLYSFSAFSNTGKTTFIEKLVAELKSRNLRVAVLKHDSHGFEMDREGKDTWRFTQAGADMVAIVSDRQTAVLENRKLTREDALSFFHDVDVILTEGYKFADCPKIAIYREASGNGLAGEPEDFEAIVTDAPFDTKVPQFPLDDVLPFAEYLLKDMQQRREA